MSIESVGWRSFDSAIKEYKSFGLVERAGELQELLSEDDSRRDFVLARSSSARAWEYTGVGVGFIENTESGSPPTIVRAGTMQADSGLKNSRVNVKLDGFVIADYPFRGTSEVLFEVSGRHHIETNGTDEPVTFARKFPVRDQGAAGITGLPLFNSLKVPPGGIGIEFRAVFLKNEKAHSFLDFLNSAPMTAGLSLAASANPAVAPFTQLARGLVSYIYQRRDGMVVHSGYVGLDFSGSLGAKIRNGTYVVAQIQGLDIDWTGWTVSSGEINRNGERFPYNYYLIRVEASSVQDPADPSTI